MRVADRVNVRAAGPDDADAVLDLWAVARSAAAVTPDDAPSVNRLIEHTAGALLVAELDGVVVGALIAAWDGWRATMYRLAVLPEVRRQGVGRRLVEEGHRRLRARGAPRVTALVAHDEVDATGLWSAAGYERDDLIVRYVRNL